MTLDPAWVRPQIDMLESKAETTDLAILALEKIQPLYNGGPRHHEFRGFVDALRTDAANYRSEAKKLKPREEVAA